MALDAVEVNFLKNQAGNFAGLNTTPAFVGGSALAPTGSYTFADANEAVSVLGQGVLTDAVCRYLDLNGGDVNVFVGNRSVSAAIGTAVSNTGGTVSLTGTPRVSGDVVVLVGNGGNATTGLFSYSLDGGQTFAPSRTMSGSNGLSLDGSGLSVAFGAGTYVAGQKATFAVHEATMDASDVSAALVQLKETVTSDPYFILLANDPVESDDGAANAQALQVGISSLRGTSTNIYTNGLAQMGGRTESQATRQLNWNAFASEDIHIEEGYAPVAISNSIPGRGFPVLPSVVDFAAAVGQSDLSSGVSAVLFGARPGVGAPIYDERRQGERGSAVRVGEYRTWPRKNGAYFSNTFLRTATSSDYQFFEQAQVRNRIAQIAVERLTTYVGSSVATNPDYTIRSDAAARIEADINNALAAELTTGIRDLFNNPGYVSAVDARVNKVNKIGLTKRLIVNISFRLHAKILNVTINIGLEPPQAA